MFSNQRVLARHKYYTRAEITHSTSIHIIIDTCVNLLILRFHGDATIALRHKNGSNRGFVSTVSHVLGCYPVRFLCRSKSETLRSWKWYVLVSIRIQNNKLFIPIQTWVMVWNDVLFLAVETQRVGTCIGTCIGVILFFKNCCFHGVEAKWWRSAIGASPWKRSISLISYHSFLIPQSVRVLLVCNVIILLIMTEILVRCCVVSLCFKTHTTQHTLQGRKYVRCVVLNFSQ